MSHHADRLPLLSRFFGLVLGTLLLFSLVLICLGLMVPALKVNSFYFFTREYSILDGIIALYEDGEIFLTILLSIFTIIFPLTKNILGLMSFSLYESNPQLMRKVLTSIRVLSKWSMVDVFAIALVVLIMNGRLLTSADIDAGVGMFAAGVLISTLAIHGLEWLYVSARTPQPTVHAVSA